MSARSPFAVAVTGAALVYGGLAFARVGRTGLRSPVPAAAGAAEPPAPTPRRSPGRTALFAAMLLFGVFVAACGVLLFLSVFLGD